ncbi:MAG: anaerobic ribonucleoside-triphosphate reductase activating protein [Kiritimatiellia bacterium]|jgi:pyruvate formate lyase activating enzyme|nr:anaerobic ribonucleoside-triphosphate reductase activating protein [Kiritimatiellia bacterium]
MKPETAPVYGFLKRPSLVDFPGHLSAVLFLSGCNFRCGFCHNATLLADDRGGVSWDRLRKKCESWKDQWVDGAVISGGEPTLSDQLIPLIEFLRGYGWSIKLDTNGSRPGVLRKCIDLVDYVAMDIKAGLSRYPEITGYQRTDDIMESISIIMSGPAEYEFRTTVLDRIHTDAQMDEIGNMIRGAKKYVIQPFVPKDNLPSEGFRTMPRTAPARLDTVGAIVEDAALEVCIRGS